LSREIDIIKLKIKHEQNRIITLTDETLISKCKKNIKHYEKEIKRLEEKESKQ
jgi:hypothetical protein